MPRIFMDLVARQASFLHICMWFHVINWHKVKVTLHMYVTVFNLDHFTLGLRLWDFGTQASSGQNYHTTHLLQPKVLLEYLE